MKFLINSIKGFYLATVVIFFLSFIGIFIKGIEWIPFTAMAFFLCICVRKEYMDIAEEVEEHLSAVVDSIIDYCASLTESGTYNLDYEYQDKFYHIELRYMVEWREEIGAAHLGDYEKLFMVTREDVEILKFECQDEFSNNYDCGFSAKDIEERL